MSTTTVNKPLTFFHPIEETFSKLEVAKRYYSMVFSIYNIPVTNQELLFVSFLSINGSLFTSALRDNFISEYKVSKAAIYNMISKLKKLQVLIKEPNKKIYINKPIRVDYTSGSITLKVKLKVETPE